ncbi:MAG: acireductone dioxygenase [Xanthomonadales bacterium]|nr:acireductone dioxygenase [Xanthomonadales bacterium]
MSRLRIFSDDQPDSPQQVLEDHATIAEALDGIGVQLEQWATKDSIGEGASPEDVLAAYKPEIDQLNARHGFQSIDVVSITPDHPQREAMRGKFLDEHFHIEDEIRFFVGGSGLFSLHTDGKVYEVLCERGDLISVPDRMTHWFDMGPEPSFIAIRFFTVPDGWVGEFTGSDIAQRFPRYEAGQAI